jgi:hypothetical protein
MAKAATFAGTWRTIAARFAASILFAAMPAAWAQVQVSGTINGKSFVDTGTVTGTFTCTGSPTCVGRYDIVSRDPGCSNAIQLADALTVTGLDLALPGPLSGSITFRNGDYNDERQPDGTCSIRPGTQGDMVFTYTGNWDGSAGSYLVRGTDQGGPYEVRGDFTATGIPVAFPMVVTGSIGPVVADVSATIQYRPQDVGTNGSVYVFALAPSTSVRPAAAIDAQPLRIQAKGAKDTPVACVLAQVTASGQLQQVSASDMKAYVTGVLSSQGQSVTVLNGVPTVQIGGATFFIGYGATSQTMLDAGVNRRVASAPGTTRCDPQKPQSGWWWNPAEGGRGFSLEVQGSNMFFASYLYDASGRSTWYAAGGALTLEGSLFHGRKLESYAGGQTMDGAYRAPTGPALGGDLTLAFNDATHGTLVWPGGTIPIERFNIVADGVNLPPQAGRPEGGWWWNSQEGGRGFFIEWQGGSAFLAAYMYDGAGNPLWYASQATTPDPGRFQGAWQQYANGQTLTGGYRQPSEVKPGPGDVGIVFQAPDAAAMTLPGGRTIPLTRFRF